jgi:Uma2 family endonuclease
MADAARKRATYADIVAAPPHLVAEIIDGQLRTHPRPSPRHAAATNSLSGELTGPFQQGRGGPGGWVFFDEPELHLGPQVVVPDIAGWKRERLAAYPDTNYFETAPDWLCEVVSSSTERRDRTVKMRIYAEAGIPHIWLVDPRLQILEAFENNAGRWTKIGAWNSDDEVRAPPFDAISFSLADLWPLDKPLGLSESPQALYAGDR